jgi:hypothetical protein
LQKAQGKRMALYKQKFTKGNSATNSGSRREWLAFQRP